MWQQIGIISFAFSFIYYLCFLSERNLKVRHEMIVFFFTCFMDIFPTFLKFLEAKYIFLFLYTNIHKQKLKTNLSVFFCG